MTSRRDLDAGAVRVFVTADGQVELEIGSPQNPARVGLNYRAADAVAAALVTASDKVSRRKEKREDICLTRSGSLRSFAVVPSTTQSLEVVLTTADGATQRISIRSELAIKLAASLFASGALISDKFSLIQH